MSVSKAFLGPIPLHHRPGRSVTLAAAGALLPVVARCDRFVQTTGAALTPTAGAGHSRHVPACQGGDATSDISLPCCDTTSGGCDMAAFFLLLAMIGGALVGDLVWENTTAGEATVLGRTAVSYPQGWLLAGAAALGFAVALLLVASVSSTRARRQRRRQLRSMRRRLEGEGIETELEHASWLDESFGRRDTADADASPRSRSDRAG